ncbi:MAG: tail fiber domain-containing protein [Lewinellaceae bacterium]|nr:tail fiber domain-containing protein [Lewinellaceae bacterium]
MRENVPGLDFISRLRPVTYWINTDKLQRHITAEMPDSIAQRYLPDAKQQAKDREYSHTGFVAQEVEAVARQIGYAFDGVNAPKNTTDNYSIAYSQFVPSLVKAVQEQQTLIEAQQAEIEQLKKRDAENATLRAQLDAQKAQLDKITAALQAAGIGVEQR